MRILWDEPKRLANLAKHGLDFADLSLDFFAGAVVVPARENRRQAAGYLGSRRIVVIFVPLGREAVSVISMRAAGRTERKWFE